MKTPVCERLQAEVSLADKSCVILRLRGSIDNGSYNVLDDALKDLFSQKRHRIILDCAEVTYISSAGVGIIINAMTEAQSNRGNLVLVGMPAGPKQTLLLFGLQDILAMVEDHAAALAHFA